MIVTVARVTDPDRFLEVFETVGAENRREHGCRGARLYSLSFSIAAGPPRRGARAGRPPSPGTET